ncbi:MAG: hypothetical protein M1820_000090 [Bogoriella megaspora]|nr:MAG: hypothetical protein M1820_000090 [Bogoriella megaspora]
MSTKHKRNTSLATTNSWSPSFNFKSSKIFHRISLTSVFHASRDNVADGVCPYLQSSERRPSSIQFDGVFSAEEQPKKKTDKEEEKKVKALVNRLHTYGIQAITERQIEYVLRSKNISGDADKAYRQLVLFEDSWDGLVKPYELSTKMLGAENRQSVTCYLDALLFAMFARLESFEAILFNSFTDKRKQLASLLRLWVNLLRTGKLITIDITKQLQESLAQCGWNEARQLQQQDASEAFTFVTGKLELPLLTLKMDIYHTGKEDVADDHKFVNERLLEVAIPSPPSDGSMITLEDCLEHYFNNRIEVKRHLQRRNTLQSVKSSKELEVKGDILHIETIEVSTPSEPSTPLSPSMSTRPVSARTRADSIFSQSEKKKPDEDSKPDFKRRKSSLRKEVLMPAWQFFSLIPWYTDNAPTSDAQVAAHFSNQRPVLGICLKRYTYTTNGNAAKLNTKIDIPLEIALPHFVSDDQMQEEGPLFGNFKLSLQSVVCHRGLSVTSGHYVSLVRDHAKRRRNTLSADRNDSSEEDDEDSQWLLFDDLARERVKVVNIEKALKDESPYLLFYQVQPIDEELARGDPPTYSEATDIKEDDLFHLNNDSHDSLANTKEPISTPTPPILEPKSQPPPTPDPRPTRISIELAPETNGRPTSQPRTRTSQDSPNQRTSIVFVEKGSDNEDARSNLTSTTNASGSIRTDAIPTAPSTPADESKTSWLGASRRSSKASNNGTTITARTQKSRPNSQSGENRLSLTMSRLTGRMSRDKLLSGLSGAGNVDNEKEKDVGGKEKVEFVGRSTEREDAPPMVEVEEVPSSRVTPGGGTPAVGTPAVATPAVEVGRLEVGVKVEGELEVKSEEVGRKSGERERKVERGKDKEKEKKGGVMRSRSRHLDKKKAKKKEVPERECAVM